MDWFGIIPYVITYVASIFTSILFYEYQRWRERTEEKGRYKSSLKLEIDKFINDWENFHKTDEMHVGSNLRNFQYKLNKIAESIEHNASILMEKGIITKEVHNKIVEISRQISALSIKEFYINGGKSWKEFIDLGNKIGKELEEIKEKL
ncbi:MAG: hypothetical protein QXX34_08280 [Candidatus Bathyarchaeia archaeon]